MDGYVHSFEGGLGYVEKDSGTSFPRSYLWMQCNDFPSACSIMISIAHIPFCGSSFRGCICAIVYQGREYRLATYKGVKVQAFTPEHICLSQGSLLLELDITSPHTGHPLCICRQGCGKEEKRYFPFKATMPPMNLYQIMGRKRKDILFSF